MRNLRRLLLPLSVFGVAMTDGLLLQDWIVVGLWIACTPLLSPGGQLITVLSRLFFVLLLAYGGENPPSLELATAIRLSPLIFELVLTGIRRPRKPSTGHSEKATPIALLAKFSALVVGVITTLDVLLLRQSNYEAFSVAVICLVAFVRLQVPRPAWRAAMLNAVLLMGSVVFSLVALELGVRVLVTSEDTGIGTAEMDFAFVSTHPQRIWTPRPGTSITAHPRGENISFHINISSLGIRDREYGPKRENEFRVLHVGDSFAMGHALEKEDTIDRLLEERVADATDAFELSVVNMACSGYGPWQEAQWLEESGDRFEPDAVLLGITMANDLHNSIEQEGRMLRAYDESWRRIVAAAWQENRGRSNPTRALRMAWKTFSVAATFYPKLDRIAGHYLSRYRFASQERISLDTIPPPEDRPPYLETYLRAWYPELQEALALFKKDVARMRDWCAERGIPFQVYLVPSKEDLSKTIWQASLQSTDATQYDRTKCRRVFQEALEDLGVSYTSLYDAFAPLPDPVSLFYEHDGHFNQEGAKVTAEAIWRTWLMPLLVDKGLLDTTVVAATDGSHAQEGSTSR